VQIVMNPADFQPIIEQAIAAALAQFGDPSRLAFKEKEAAALIGQKSHVLRDARLRGEVSASKVGRGFVYTRAYLLAFLERRKERDV
jgi:hypothetical protein